ncbi:MAG: hypothetical protein ACXACO_08185 [Promethearchaeota archaeon]|jgi:hypothetical protein
MVTRSRKITSLGGLEKILIEKQDENKFQSIEDEIIKFFNRIPEIPKRDHIIAKNQILSLYRRMKYYPKKKDLNNYYVDNILQIINLQEGNAK